MTREPLIFTPADRAARRASWRTDLLLMITLSCLALGLAFGGCF